MFSACLQQAVLLSTSPDIPPTPHPPLVAPDDMQAGAAQTVVQAPAPSCEDSGQAKGGTGRAKGDPGYAKGGPGHAKRGPGHPKVGPGNSPKTADAGTLGARL